MELSNKTLSFLVILAMGVSLVSTIYLIYQAHLIFVNPTGKAPSGTGEVNLSVESVISIILYNNSIDFGSGFVNTSKCTNATLSIRHDSGANTYNDSNGNDCWRSTTGADVPAPQNMFKVVNTGTQNVTLTVLGPEPIDFFTGINPPTASPDLYNLSWQGENIDNGCTSGLVTVWTTFNGSIQTICPNNGFGYTPNNDELAINIKVQIPGSGIDTGREYRNDSIEFTAS